MKYILSLIITTFFVSAVFGLTRVRNRYENESQIFTEFVNLYDNVQSRQFRVVTSTPNVNNLIEQEIVILNSTTKQLVTRLDNNLYFTEMIQK